MIHKGSCHCQQVQFEIEADGVYQDIYRCNCTLCRKKSIIMKSVHHSAFTLATGKDHLSLYQWNKNIAEHYFCKVCGIYTHHKRRRDPEQISVNLECLDGIATPAPEQVALVDGAAHS